jgi:hypothetical protein
MAQICPLSLLLSSRQAEKLSTMKASDGTNGGISLAAERRLHLGFSRMESMQPLTLTLALIFMSIVAANDLRERRIPNRLNLAGLVVGMTLQTVNGGCARFFFRGVGLSCRVCYSVLALRRGNGRRGGREVRSGRLERFLVGGCC